MPHYKDGTEAKVGDVVKGKPYNTPCEVVGTVVQITPGSESCNLVVAFTHVERISTEEQNTLAKHAHGVRHVFISRDGPMLVLGKTDYGETKAFEKLFDAP